MHTRPLLALTIIALSSCIEPRASHPSASQTITVAPTSPSRLDAPYGGVQSPLHVSWITVQFDDHRAVLRAHVERSPTLTLPLTLSVTAPAGVRVERGATSFALPPAAQQSVADYDYELSYARTPDDDVLLSVDGDSESMGVHGRATFRFGRPEPLGPRPVADGPGLVLGGRDYGRAVRAVP